MSKILLIAEKPDVGKELAKYFGSHTQQKNGYIEGDDYIFTWGYGHILELLMPHEYNKKYKKWRKEDLPLIPPKYKHKVSHGKKEQFNTIKSLINRKDIVEIVNACDADREGELIFRLIYYYSRPPKDLPVSRMWFDTKEKNELLKAFKDREPMDHYNNLYNEAVTRSIIDWSMGINFSRLYSILYPDTYSVGRVQTPTLKIIVDRELEIQKFKPEDYYEIEGYFDKQKTKLFFNNKVSNNAIYDLEKGSNIFNRLNESKAQGVIEKLDKKQKKKSPPRLYDLSTLQQDANKRYGYSPKDTLNIAQSLYERHKLLSYPRSDSRYLKKAMLAEIPSILSGISKAINNDITNEIYEKKMTFHRKNFNDSKVDGHRAITPTATSKSLKTLSHKEKNIYLLVANRFLEQYLGDYVYNLTKVYIKFEDHNFYTKASQDVNLGWKKVDSKTQESSVPMAWVEGYAVEKTNMELLKKQTTPEPRYNGQTIIKAMKKYNLGTPATQADIIEKLKQKKYITKKSKSFVALEKGILLINEIVDDKIKSVELTKTMENQLKAIRKGTFTRDEYIDQVHSYVTSVIEHTHIKEELVSKLQKNSSFGNNNNNNKESIGKCPICVANVFEGKVNYYCSNTACKFALWKNDIIWKKFKKGITKNRAMTILKDQKIFLKGIGTFKLIINPKESQYLTSWDIDFEDNKK